MNDIFTSFFRSISYFPDLVYGLREITAPVRAGATAAKLARVTFALCSKEIRDGPPAATRSPCHIIPVAQALLGTPKFQDPQRTPIDQW